MNINNYRELTGDIILYGEYGYDQARQIWNRAIQKYPLMIVYPHNVNDVKNAILYARAHGIPIRIRNGGHSYEGYCIDNQVMVIDIKHLNNATVDKNKNLIRMQAGVKNYQAYQVIIDNGYMFPGGDCPTVGASGYILGGGWGYLSRYLGLGNDQVVEIELVDYDGNLIIANEKENADLFWACRGAGSGNFGVVVSITVKVYPQASIYTYYEINIDNPTFNDQLIFLKAWQDILNGLDNKAGMNVIINNTENGFNIFGNGTYIGTMTEFQNNLKPFMEIPNIKVMFKHYIYKELISQLFIGPPEYEKLKNVGLFTNYYYNDQELTNMLKLIQKKPSGSVNLSLSFYSFGGKIADVSKELTPSYYRDAKYLIVLRSIWKEDIFAAENIDFVNNCYKYLKLKTKGAFFNNPYSELVDYEYEYFGENKHRLKEVKRKYDPYNVFNYEQSIKL